MLRRKQVMMTDWLDDMVKFIAKSYDLSYSEFVRIAVGYHIAEVMAAKKPGCKLTITPKKIAYITDKYDADKSSLEENRQLIADIYFQTKRIITNYMKDMKKKKR